MKNAVRLYVAQSRHSPIGMKEFCVFETHIVFRVAKGTFAVSYEILVFCAPNMVDGFKKWLQQHNLDLVYCCLDQVTVKDQGRVRKRIRRMERSQGGP